MAKSLMNQMRFTSITAYYAYWDPNSLKKVSDALGCFQLFECPFHEIVIRPLVAEWLKSSMRVVFLRLISYTLVFKSLDQYPKSIERYLLSDVEKKTIRY